MPVPFGMVDPIHDTALCLDKALVGLWRVVVFCHCGPKEKKDRPKNGCTWDI